MKKSVNIGLGASASLVLPSYSEGLFAQESLPELVAVMGADPEIMFDRAIDAFGGIRRFVKPNQTVVIKPNIGWDQTPERGANTNPLLVKQIVKHCLGAGAKKVYVFDHTADQWRKCYDRSGIKYSVKEAGGVMVPGNNERHYHPITIPEGKSLKKAYAHELFLEADVFINVPVLKNHIATKLTIGMKNLMGVVWDRGWWHRNDLHQCIADFASYKVPTLTVVDAYRVLTANGPMGVSDSDAIMMKALLLSTDPVAADTAAAKLYGLDPAGLQYITKAQSLGIGTTDLASMNIKKIRL